VEPREIYERFRAVLFDMDGVLTTTARLHSAAWQRTFDEFLERWDESHGTVTPRFSPAEDYLRYVDGKPRYDGVRDFLASRNIVLPDGSADSSPDEESVGGIGNRKQQLVESALHTEGVEAFPGSVAWVRELQARGLATAVVSSSQNCAEVLDAAGIADLFDVRVDGAVAVELQLPGKPEPDTFLEAALRLGVDPSDAVVVEDALAGVQAGRAGGFGLVIGVDRDEQTDALVAHGADMVVKDLGDLVTESAEAGHMAGPKAHRLRAAALRLLAADEEFPVDEFRLVERGFNPDNVPQLEAVFAVANGYLGLRGTHEEGRPVHQSGTLLNGLYETWPIVYPEKAFGFAETGQTIVNATDGSVIKLYVDDEPFDLDHAEVLEYERVLDMRAGVMERRVIWQMADGRRFSVRSKRMVSLDQRHLACIEYVVTALDRPAALTISSELVTHTGADAGTSEDPRKGRGFEPGVLMPKSGRTSGARVVLGFQTRSSGQRMSCGMDHETNLGEDVLPETEVNGDSARAVYRVKAQPGRPVRLIKYLGYHHAADESVDELSFRVGGTLDRARAEGLDAIFVNQRQRIDAFWATADVRTEGAPLLQQAMRFSLYQLLQASACSEGFGIPSKGLTGQGYEGHYFWDTEIYVMPFLVYTAPNLARSLLHHRYAMLEQARERAQQVGLNGALFPWRTINGKEASAYYAAGTAQYHIDADVAYALMQYVRVTGDRDFLARYGAEILVETARMWADLGYFSSQKRGHFVINGVTGPDEYSTVVDNNAYTNLMARQNMRSAIEAVEWLAASEPEAHARLIDRTKLHNGEIEDWRRAADLMYVPYDDAKELHLQDDGFLDREVWDFEGTPPENYPLLLHYHPLVIYRHQVIKQADIVLATFLVGDEFTPAEKRKIFAYYDPLTTGDSSLSECIQSIVAAEIGDVRAAEEYFIDAAAVDLADVANNVRDGVHVASAGGTWLAAVYGFAGLRDGGAELSFRPLLPERLTALAFTLRTRGCVLDVELRDGAALYRLREGDLLRILHHGEPIDVTQEGVSRPLGASVTDATAKSA
jgi:alpha,alpha-trehalose phosphorylase